MIKWRSKNWLDSRLADLTGLLIDRISDQVKLSFGDSWFSHVDRLICFVALQCEVCSFNLGFSFIVDGNTSDWGPNRTPLGGISRRLTEMGGTRCYITLFEAPFQASVLTDSENNALRASSLMAIPPPPPGSQPLAGSTAVDLMGNNLTQWALDVQEVASYMGGLLRRP